MSKAIISESSSERINDLEIQVSFLESTVETLNQQVITQQKELSDLKHEQSIIKTLIQKLAGAAGDAELPASYDPLLEKPPHY